VAKTNDLEAGILGLILNGTAIANLADNAASSPLTSFYVSLHTASPGDTGDQTTSEATYTGYARVALSRAGAAWTISNGTATLNNNITFAECTASSNTITHFGIGSASSGTGVLYYYGALSSSISVISGVTPRILAGSTITED